MTKHVLVYSTIKKVKAHNAALVVADRSDPFAVSRIRSELENGTCALGTPRQIMDHEKRRRSYHRPAV